MIPNSEMTRRTSNRIRKMKRTYSPSADDNNSLNIPSTSRKIREPCSISLDNSKSLSNLSSKRSRVMQKEVTVPKNSCKLSIAEKSSLSSQVVNDEEHGSITLNHDSFWNFATTLSYPILRDKVANDKVITLLLKEVSKAIRQLILGAKLVMQKAGRQKLLFDDLNTFIEMKGGKLLFGFTEDNKWKKIGDVFVPDDEVIDLRFCSPSVKLETLSGK